MSLNSDQAWINLNQLLNEIGHRRGYSTLDRLCQQVLEWVAKTALSGQPIYVQTIIMNSGVASPATLHKAMGVLEDEGFLQFKKDPTDTRRRIVLLTKKSDALFRAMSQDLLKALSKFPRS